MATMTLNTTALGSNLSRWTNVDNRCVGGMSALPCPRAESGLSTTGPLSDIIARLYQHRLGEYSQTEMLNFRTSLNY